MNPRLTRRSRKYVHRKGQEARLYIACVASIILPASLLMFAWTARTDIPWIVPLIGLTVSTTRPSTFPISTDGPDSFSWLPLSSYIKSCSSTWQTGEHLVPVLLRSPIDEYRELATGLMHHRRWQ